MKTNNEKVKKSSVQIVLATGGTGGHVFPARSVANELQKKGKKVTILADINYIRYKRTKDRQGKIPHQYIHVGKATKHPIKLINNIFSALSGTLQAMSFIRKNNVKLIIGFGGYASFPTVLAGVLLRRKIVLHEQNAYMGRVNRIFARFAKKIVVSYKETEGIKAKYKDKVVYTGNPIRHSITPLINEEYTLPYCCDTQADVKKQGYDLTFASDIGKEDEKFNIVIIGGSGGASIFADIIPEALFNLSKEWKSKIKIIQQCRRENINAVYDKYTSFNLNAHLQCFFDNMYDVIKNAHLVITRSGAASISELSLAGKPCIFIPFKHAADNHQEKNLKHLDGESAVIINEDDLDSIDLSKKIEELLDNPDILRKMSDNIRKDIVLDADKRVSSEIIKLLNAKK